ncbi:UNVERIFIED_CONTAM: NADPH-dependent oxidoreductase 2-alkenal reductase [Sesamum radiatum]|uniref:NADPH-dependent oxidoreductase 2-alkenal reductase n=1 Tax=Sesamum radiatum TaxID=300843 RepID=A0AAW2KSP6_SESRA
MLEAAVENMNSFGRVAACGVMSEYTDSLRKGKLDMVQLIYKRIRIQGFLALDFMNIYHQFISTTTQYLQTCKIKAIEDIYYGVESIPMASVDIFRGNNIGKKIVRTRGANELSLAENLCSSSFVKYQCK